MNGRHLVVAALLAVAASLFLARGAAAAGPSAHCHVTDGAFTTCADGSREWSDVAPLRFPDAFLYADEADLDPSLSSPGSPADTLMLMYDECGRTQPLGPDEPFVVSFATVEDEDGHSELVHYVIHVFTDGTIVFFENGVAQRDDAGRTRVREIEGQRGAAGFGPSPNCPADHVVAEFEIKLTATGLKLNGGYSPDPIFWGAEPPNRPPIAVDDADRIDVGQTQVTVDVIANDTDPDDAVDPATVNVLSPPQNGTATSNGDGTVTYAPTSGGGGGDVDSPTDSFTYQVADTKGAVSNAAKVEITSCPGGQTMPVTLPEVKVDAPLLKPFTVKYEQLPLTFTSATPTAPAYCHADSSVGTLNVDVTCRLINLTPVPCPFLPFVPVTVAHSTATASLDFFKAGDVPAPPACNWSNVTTGCLLNPGAGGDLVEWHTPGFHITDRFDVVTIHDTGPHTFYAFTGGLVGSNASFAQKVQAVETYFHTTLISHLSSIDRLAVVQDPPADVLVTDPDGRQTGLRADGTTVEDIPASAYYRSDFGTAVVIAEPQTATYDVKVVGPAGQPYRLSMATLDLRDTAAVAGVSEDDEFGTIDPGNPATTDFSFDVPSRNPANGAEISNGLVQLGVNREGDLNVFDGTARDGAVGVRFLPNGNEAVAPGCLCEGWGVADAIGGVFGAADVDVGGVRNVTVESFHASDTTAVSTVRIGDTFRVRQDYHPSASPNLFEDTVTIENTSGAPVDLRYRRAVDWDVEPTAFREFVTVVTIQGADRARDVLFSSDDGFADPNPLAGPSEILFTGDAVDSGPADHGALFDLGFGLLAPGGKVTFELYYGAAASEAEANAALRDVGAKVYSFGQPSTPGGASTGAPNTFILGFKGVGEPVDSDGDTVADDLDNCPSTPNTDQHDSNLNGIGDACEVDGVDHSTAAFLQAGLDGSTVVEAQPVAAADEPSFEERLVRIVEFRVDAGLTDDPAGLADDLVDSLVEAGAVAPADADTLVGDVLADVEGVPTAQVTFPASNGANGWFVTSPVEGAVTATAPAGGRIASVDCTGATVGPISGLGTVSATATLSVTGDGVHAISCTATNASGRSGDPAAATVRIDTTAPSVACTASPASLWPPNHRLVAASVAVTLGDALSGPAGFTLASAASSEPDDGLGDGDTAGDLQGWSVGTADVAGLLRAERSGTGPGRTYTLTYRAADAAGNAATCAARVGVPHSR